MDNPKQCLFNGCTKPVFAGFNRCQAHKHRSPCSVLNCPNQVYARYLCVRHGGKRICAFENCTTYARGGGFCGKHGGTVNKRFCLIEGCKKQAHANQKCVRHGGGRFCKADGCAFHSKAGGFCLKHQASIPTTQSDTSDDVLDTAILDCILNVDDNETLAKPASNVATDIQPLDMTVLDPIFVPI